VNFPSVAEQPEWRLCVGKMNSFIGEIVVGLFINLHFSARLYLSLSSSKLLFVYTVYALSTICSNTCFTSSASLLLLPIRV